MKTKITPKDYKDIYEACNWNPRIFSKALKALGYSDELIVYRNLNLYGTPIQSLVNIKEVNGWINLRETSIESLGNLQTVGSYLDLEGTSIQSLGNLKEVGWYLYLQDTPIQSLGNLKRVRGPLYLEGTPLSKKYSEEEIRKIVKVDDGVFLG